MIHGYVSESRNITLKLIFHKFKVIVVKFTNFKCRSSLFMPIKTNSIYTAFANDLHDLLYDMRVANLDRLESIFSLLVDIGDWCKEMQLMNKCVYFAS